MKNILLHTPEGVRDIYGNELAGKEHIEQVIGRKLSSFGYESIETPTFEFFDVFSKERRRPNVNRTLPESKRQ